MTAYAVTGTLSPDATTPNTGEPAGTLNGQPYWSWTNDAGTWHLFFSEDYWVIGTGFEIRELPGTWQRNSFSGIAGGYSVDGEYTGTATVAEYVPEEESSGSSESSSFSSLSESSVSSGSSSSASSSSQSSSSSSSASSSQSSGTIDLPRSCTVTVTGTFSFTAVIERPT